MSSTSLTTESVTLSASTGRVTVEVPMDQSEKILDYLREQGMFSVLSLDLMGGQVKLELRKGIDVPQALTALASVGVNASSLVSERMPTMRNRETAFMRTAAPLPHFVTCQV